MLPAHASDLQQLQTEALRILASLTWGVGDRSGRGREIRAGQGGSSRSQEVSAAGRAPAQTGNSMDGRERGDWGRTGGVNRWANVHMGGVMDGERTEGSGMDTQMMDNEWVTDRDGYVGEWVSG